MDAILEAPLYPRWVQFAMHLRCWWVPSGETFPLGVSKSLV